MIRAGKRAEWRVGPVTATRRFASPRARKSGRPVRCFAVCSAVQSTRGLTAHDLEVRAPGTAFFQCDLHNELLGRPVWTKEMPPTASRRDLRDRAAAIGPDVGGNSSVRVLAGPTRERVCDGPPLDAAACRRTVYAAIQ